MEGIIYYVNYSKMDLASSITFLNIMFKRSNDYNFKTILNTNIIEACYILFKGMYKKNILVDSPIFRNINCEHLLYLSGYHLYFYINIGKYIKYRYLHFIRNRLDDLYRDNYYSKYNIGLSIPNFTDFIILNTSTYNKYIDRKYYGLVQNGKQISLLKHKDIKCYLIKDRILQCFCDKHKKSKKYNYIVNHIKTYIQFIKKTWIPNKQMSYVDYKYHTDNYIMLCLHRYFTFNYKLINELILALN